MVGKVLVQCCLERPASLGGELVFLARLGLADRSDIPQWSAYNQR